jgi:hypothetical protein
MSWNRRSSARRIWWLWYLVITSPVCSAHFNPADVSMTHLRQDTVPAVALRTSERTRDRTLGLQRLLGALGPRAAAATSGGDPALLGRWSDLDPWPIVAIQAALLPNGAVLAYDSVGDAAAESYTEHTFTRVTVWDPLTNTHTFANNATGYNLFCSGLAHLPDGREFLAGGNRTNLLDGIDATHLFDYATNTWTLGPTMTQGGRWYPSVTPLTNGEMLISGGGPTIPEVLATDATLRTLTDAYSSLPLYPWLQVAPDGAVAFLGPTSTLRTLSTADTGQWHDYSDRDSVNRTYGSHALFDIGKVLVAGGGNSETSTVVVDLNTHTATSTGSMNHGRRQHNLTLLADGSVLATGGNSSGVDLVDLSNGVYAAERWDPSTGLWTELASMQQTRQYHSTALLLPDGRVLSAGGGVCGACTTAGYLAKDAEIYSPPYLFLNNGSHTLAPRPSIVTAPDSVRYESPFTVTTAEASHIRKVALVRLSSVTHSVNFEQRYVPLSFHAGSGALRIVAPAMPNIAPPGHYLLFLLDEHGVPSVARILRLDPTASEPANAAPGVDNPGTQTSKYGGAVDLSLAATDPEAGPLSYSANGLPPGLNIRQRNTARAGQLSGRGHGNR